MDALYNRNGQVAAWLDRVDGEIVDLKGRQIAFLNGENVYDYSGRHLGWWAHDHFRDHQGAVGVFTAEATNMGVWKPFLAYAPYPPYKQPSPFRPFTDFAPFKSFDAWVWSSGGILA